MGSGFVHPREKGRGSRIVPSQCEKTVASFPLIFGGVPFASLRLGETRLSPMPENAIAKEVVDVAYRVHTTLGPGLLESVYETILANQLSKRNLRVIRQQPIPLIYDDTRFTIGFRADPVVEGKVIVEIKSIADLTPLH